MKNDLLHIPEFDINIVYCQNIEIYSQDSSVDR